MFIKFCFICVVNFDLVIFFTIVQLLIMIFFLFFVFLIAFSRFVTIRTIIIDAFSKIKFLNTLNA